MVQTPTHNPHAAPVAPSVPDTGRFLQANRVHVAGGSLFIDPYLVVHPRELAAGNEAGLRQKLELTFGLNNPSFYESPDRMPIALKLADLVPVSLSSKRSRLMGEIATFNHENNTRTDSDLAGQAGDRAQPFAAIVRDTIQEPASDPVGAEMLKNGLAFYLLLRESLTRHGYLDTLNSYVRFNNTPDQILTSLQDKIGVSSETLMESARTGGIAGVARALGLEESYLKEANALVDRASKHEFSYNMIEHWHLGRQLLKDRPQATLDDKIAVGFERRILDTMGELRRKSKGQTDVPDAIKTKERWVAEGIGMVPPIQRQLLWDLGYELSYTDEPTADKIAFHDSIYGLHRTTKDDVNALRGTYRIYFGSKNDPEGAHRTLVHEITHNLWPNLFSAQETAEIDRLANADRERIKTVARTLRADFPVFKGFMDAYHAANATPAQQASILQQANARYATTLGPLNALFAENKNPYEVLDMAEHADQRLHVDGLLYKQSGYHGPQERFREVLSRYAELRYVRLRNEPALMNFLAPGLTKIYDGHYLPHLERLHQQIVNGQAAQPNIAHARRRFAEEAPEATSPADAAIALPPTATNDNPHRPVPQPEEAASTQPSPPAVSPVPAPKPIPLPEKLDLKADAPAAVNDNLKAAQNDNRPYAHAVGASASAASETGSKRPGTTVSASSIQMVSALRELDRMGIDVGMNR